MIDVLEELPANIVDKILEKSSERRTQAYQHLPQLSGEQRGQFNDPGLYQLAERYDGKGSSGLYKKEGMDSETIYTCYVKDTGRKLIGIVSLRSLVISDDDVIEKDIMQTDFVYVNVLDDQEQVSNMFKKYGFLAMPVVDNENRIVGIITVDDILDIIDEETTEDFQKMVGVTVSTVEYLDMSVWTHVKNRFPWLLFLMVSLMITGMIIAQFETLLSKVIVLVAYLPLLMGTGGNSGSQSATLVIRGIAVGDICPGCQVHIMERAESAF